MSLVGGLKESIWEFSKEQPNEFNETIGDSATHETPQIMTPVISLSPDAKS